ncbi:hypothetical protein TNCV_2788121 [Trichonephila clavipes]|uniref:Uncharacterized protein n=1 Tax=Trichonephila clavipes TaxID=2585209 RepID=A0A8X6SS34_TRICX|nr:hypothetical protein TNCV_2788121 [Trichonephila clavipes]
MEIGTSSPDNGSLRDESSGFDRDQMTREMVKRKGQKKREESRPTIERKTQQGGPSRSRKGRERNDSPYIEERTRSSNKNARRGGEQQRQHQERRGTWTKKSLSLEVLVGNANYTSHKNQVVSFLIIFFRTSGRKNFCNKAKSRSDS